MIASLQPLKTPNAVIGRRGCLCWCITAKEREVTLSSPAHSLVKIILTKTSNYSSHHWPNTASYNINELLYMFKCGCVCVCALVIEGLGEIQRAKRERERERGFVCVCFVHMCVHMGVCAWVHSLHFHKHIMCAAFTTSYAVIFSGTIHGICHRGEVCFSNAHLTHLHCSWKHQSTCA